MDEAKTHAILDDVEEALGHIRSAIERIDIGNAQAEKGFNVAWTITEIRRQLQQAERLLKDALK